MPQAPDWLRDYWGGVDAAPALRHLEERGFKVSDEFVITPPHEHELETRDMFAIEFLIAEWDYDYDGGAA